MPSLFVVLVPLIELVLLSQLLQRTGMMTTLLVVFLTGIVGVSLTRRQGMKAWKGAHQQMAQGKSPSKEILDGVMILLAGAFLITPGPADRLRWFFSADAASAHKNRAPPDKLVQSPDSREVSNEFLDDRQLRHGQLAP